MGVLKTVRKSVDAHVPSASGGVQWEDAPLELTRRCVFAQFYGDTSTGRTSLALTAPGPIALLHASEKLEGIVQPVRRTGKIIKLHNFGGTFRGSNEAVQRQAEEIERQMIDHFYEAFTWARTIIIDTDTEAYQLTRLAEFGALKPSGGRIETNWEGVNARWRSLLNAQRDQDRTNVILIGQTEDEWAKGKGDKMGNKTGRTIRSGHKHIPIKADLGIRTFVQNGEFMLRVEKPWWNSAFMGEEIPAMPFDQLMGMLTETDPDEWGEGR